MQLSTTFFRKARRQERRVRERRLDAGAVPGPAAPVRAVQRVAAEGEAVARARLVPVRAPYRRQRHRLRRPHRRRRRCLSKAAYTAATTPA